MFEWLWTIIDIVQRKTASFLGWCRDPWSGNRMTRPLSRDYTSTGESLIYIIAHRTGSAIYSVLYVLIFDGLATAAKFGIGVLSDLWHSDYKYGRYAAGLAVSGIKVTVSGLIAGIIFVSTLAKTLIFKK